MSYLSREELTQAIAQKDQIITSLQLQVNDLQYMINEMQINISSKDTIITEKDATINKYYRIRDYINENAIANGYLTLIQFVEETDPSQISN